MDNVMSVTLYVTLCDCWIHGQCDERNTLCNFVWLLNDEHNIMLYVTLCDRWIHGQCDAFCYFGVESKEKSDTFPASVITLMVESFQILFERSHRHDTTMFLSCFIFIPVSDAVTLMMIIVIMTHIYIYLCVCFQAYRNYVYSISMMKNKKVFDVSKLDLEQFAKWVHPVLCF